MKTEIVEFDKGTTIIRNANTALRLPDAVHDERIAAIRLPGRSYQAALNAMSPSSETNATSQIELKTCDIALNPHQHLALQAWLKANKTGIITLPTGAGKTHIALKAIALCKVRTLILVPTIVLMDQWFFRLSSQFGPVVSRFGNGHHDVLDICVSTFESAYRHARRLWSHFDFLIVDEAHHFGDGLRDEFLDMSCAPLRLGLSATLPSDESKMQGLRKRIGPVVFEASLIELVGVALSRFLIHRADVSLPAEDFQTYRKYADKVMSARKSIGGKSYEEFIQLATKTAAGREAIVYAQLAKKIVSAHDAKLPVVANLLRLHAADRILLFTYDSADAIKIASCFQIPLIVAATPKNERDWILNEFRAGTLPAIVTCRVLNEGYDVPEANVAIFVSTFCANRDFIQRMGRVLRPKANGIAHIYEILARRTQEEKMSHLRAKALRLGGFYARS